jgi:hypothetical protein
MNIWKTLAVCAILAVTMYCTEVLAHSPNAIDATYDMPRGELNVIVEHLVNDPWQHYVKDVLVFRSGTKVLKKEFDFQTSHRNLTIPPMKLPASVGDELRIFALCSEGGQYEVTIKVGAPEERAEQGPIEHDMEK